MSRCRMPSGQEAAVKLANLHAPEARMLKTEVAALQRLEPMHGNGVPQVLAAGIGLEGTAVIVATEFIDGWCACVSVSVQSN